MENVCWKTRPPNIANMLSIKHSSIVMMSASDNFWLESDFFYTFTKQDCPFRTQCICICFGLFLTPICFVGGSCCIYVICIYLRILVSNTISISDDKCRLTVTRRMSHVEQELLTLPQHLKSTLGFSGISVARSLVFCAMLCRSLCVLFVIFLFGHCVVCSSSIYPGAHEGQAVYASYNKQNQCNARYKNQDYCSDLEDNRDDCNIS